MNKNILEIQNLTVEFKLEKSVIRAVDDVTLDIGPSEVLGLVGESGCGKSTTALSLLKLIPSPPGRISGGKILWKKNNLLELPIEEMRSVRGREISMIFQEPLSSFNPVQKIGKQVEEALFIHENIEKESARERVIKMFGHVGLKNPEQVFESYPHELSGGMRQRAMIAMALICRPELLIADEPTTALDVTIQAQILSLLKDLQEENRMSVLLITHNLGIVAQMADRVAVMYTGKIIENSPVFNLFKNPLHPYTQALLKSVPNPNRKGKMYVIPGSIPNMADLPGGCPFNPRCEFVMPVCREKFPETKELEPGHSTACWLYQES